MTEIYKTTCNICSKIYIGKHHINEKKLNNYLGSGKKFKKHTKEHGRDNFTKQILLYCEDKDVKYYEEVLIKLYDATNPEIGLNISKKSTGLEKHSEESKQKMRNNHADFSGKNHPMFGKIGYWKEKHRTSETKEKIRQSSLGKKHTEQTKQLCKRINLGKKQSKEHIQNNIKAHQKPVNAYIGKTNEFIGTFESIKDAGEELNLQSSHIVKVCKNKLKTIGGYIFKYA